MRTEPPAAHDADRCWSNFWQTGRVQDYLDYRRAADAAAGEEPHHADRNGRPGAAGTTAG